MKKTRILIAEDHEVIAYGLKAMFQENPHLEFCAEVNEAQQILSQIKLEQADVLILDANIHGINTLTLLPEIKRNFEDLKVIIFTAYDTPFMERKALLHGADAFLNKKTRKQKLLQTILNFHKNTPKSDSNTTLENQKTKKDVLDKFMIERMLTSRELEILKLVASGKTSQQIAEPLFISKHTVQWHRKNIIKKLDLHTTGELIRFVYEHGLA